MFPVISSHLTLFAVFGLLVILGSALLYLASLNTKNGEFVWQSGFKLHGAFNSDPYTDRGNFYRKAGLACWLFQLVIIFYMVVVS